MAMQWFSILPVFEWMGVDNYFTVVDVCMFEKCIAAENSQKENKNKISRNFLSRILQSDIN